LTLSRRAIFRFVFGALAHGQWIGFIHSTGWALGLR
jgi:hypothetical protein